MSTLLDSMKFTIVPGLGDTIVLLGGKIDFGGKDEGTSIVVCRKKTIHVLEALGAELPDDLDTDFEVVPVGARSEHKTEWELTETTLLPNANGDVYDFGRLQKASDGMPKFENEHANRLVSIEHVHQIMMRPTWSVYILCPAMREWAEKISAPHSVGAMEPTHVQFFTCGIGPKFMAYESTPKYGKFMQNLFDRNLPMQRAMWPRIDPSRTGLLGGPS